MNKIKEEMKMIHVPIFKYEQINAKKNLYSSIYWQHLQEYC